MPALSLQQGQAQGKLQKLLTACEVCVVLVDSVVAAKASPEAKQRPPAVGLFRGNEAAVAIRASGRPAVLLQESVLAWDSRDKPVVLLVVSAAAVAAASAVVPVVVPASAPKGKPGVVLVVSAVVVAAASAAVLVAVVPALSAVVVALPLPVAAALLLDSAMQLPADVVAFVVVAALALAVLEFVAAAFATFVAAVAVVAVGGQVLSQPGGHCSALLGAETVVGAVVIGGVVWLFLPPASGSGLKGWEVAGSAKSSLQIVLLWASSA